MKTEARKYDLRLRFCDQKLELDVFRFECEARSGFVSAEKEETRRRLERKIGE